MGSKTAAPRWHEHYGVARAIVMFGCPREERCSGRGYEMIYLSVCCSIRDGLLHHRRTHTHTHTHSCRYAWCTALVILYQSVGVG